MLVDTIHSVFRIFSGGALSRAPREARLARASARRGTGHVGCSISSTFESPVSLTRHLSFAMQCRRTVLLLHEILATSTKKPETVAPSAAMMSASANATVSGAVPGAAAIRERTLACAYSRA